jgi:hypothetical protein
LQLHRVWQPIAPSMIDKHLRLVGLILNNQQVALRTVALTFELAQWGG